MAKRITSTWKAAERAIAKFWPGARRRGSDFRGEDGVGKSDIVCPGWSIEVKHGKTITYGLLVHAVEQAETNKPFENDIPLAVVHKEGQAYKDSLVIMRLETFAEFFINSTSE